MCTQWIHQVSSLFDSIVTFKELEHPHIPLKMFGCVCARALFIHLIFTVVSFQLHSQFESRGEAGNCEADRSHLGPQQFKACESVLTVWHN